MDKYESQQQYLKSVNHPYAIVAVIIVAFIFALIIFNLQTAKSIRNFNKAIKYIGYAIFASAAFFMILLILRDILNGI